MPTERDNWLANLPKYANAFDLFFSNYFNQATALLFSAKCKSLIPWSVNRCNNLDSEIFEKKIISLNTNTKWKKWVFSITFQHIIENLLQVQSFQSRSKTNNFKMTKKKQVAYEQIKHTFFFCYIFRHSPWN